jgi:hypothetical protein
VTPLAHGGARDEALGNNASGERFQSLLQRFESTVQEARDARESIVGSFDVLIARPGHRTNHVIKVLTLTSVIFLPGALLAGVMGMNFKVALSGQAWLFYVVVAMVIMVAPITFGVAKFPRLDLSGFHSAGAKGSNALRPEPHLGGTCRGPTVLAASDLRRFRILPLLRFTGVSRQPS